MQTIQETIDRYHNADDALYQAEQLVEQLKKQANTILANNTEPVAVPSIDGTGPGHKITTPSDLSRQTNGVVIRVGGIEYMKVSPGCGDWIDFAGYKTDRNTLFRRLLIHADDCAIIHAGS